MQTYSRFILTADGKLLPINTTAYHHNNKSLGFNVRNSSLRMNSTFQERLVLCLQKHGLTLAEFHRMLKDMMVQYSVDRVHDNVSFSYSTLRAYYHGKCVPKTSRLRFIAKMFGVSEYWMEGSANLESELIGMEAVTRMPKKRPSGYIIPERDDRAA